MYSLGFDYGVWCYDRKKEVDHTRWEGAEPLSDLCGHPVLGVMVLPHEGKEGGETPCRLEEHLDA